MASSGIAPKNNEVTLDVEARDRKTLEIRQFFPYLKTVMNMNISRMFIFSSP